MLNSEISLGPLREAEMVHMLVGPSKQEFNIHKKLLCAESDFFRCKLETIESVPSSPEDELPAACTAHHDKILWLSEECPEMMELFVLWLYQKDTFRILLDHMIASVAVQPKPLNKANIQHSRRALHWNLVRLHLFAADTRQPALQDMAMDAIQDFYLRCDWDVSARLVRYLYQERPRDESLRLRKWAVAMLAWALSHDVGDSLAYDELFAESPDLRGDYVKHVDRTVDSKADVRVKNPQLRLPRNKLQNGERHFGFRQCSFHSHRSSVGEGRCPHDLEQVSLLSPAVDSGIEDALVQPLSVDAEAAPPHTRLDDIRLKSNDSFIWTVLESAEET
ncbi:hypothetical protein VMCG_00953 [Cytospora schulzeri]|uniref:BTB domain-containing protein n=1 Tax=Cytospora schulzeri TaxID=448051 RepID=A0A423X5S7_9PEZI|nr:hypothetical protein VMCG_00953 [Valsa malicola]